MEKNENFSKELETQYTILIRAEEKRTKKRIILVFIIISLTLISSLISCFFAIKAYNSTKKETKEEEIITVNNTISSAFNTTSKLALTEIGNNYVLKTPKVIRIENEGDEELTYNISLTSINTSLLSTNHLTYTLIKNNETIEEKQLPLTDSVIVSNQTIAKGETITYMIRVSYTGAMEANNYTNYYNANIIVDTNDSKTDLLK